MLNQLSKKNDLALHNKTSIINVSTISVYTESTKSSNKTKKSNTERVQKMRHTIQNNLHHSGKIPYNVSAKENPDNCEDNSSTNSRDINSKVANLIILVNSMLKHLNGWEM